MNLDLPKETPKSETSQHTIIEKSNFSKRTRWRQWLASISATLSMVAVGTVYGWTTTSLSKLMSKESDAPMRITEDESSWIVSLTVIGSMIGPFLGAYLADRYGRKRCLLFSSGFYIAGWTIVFFAKSVSALYVARVILGIGVGVSYTTNPMYVSEVADVNIRGALGTLIAVNVFTGSLLTCSIGPWISYRTLVIVLLTIPVLFIVTFIWFPESPHFLAARGRKTEASRSLAFFKGIRDQDEARRELELALQAGSNEDSRDNNKLVLDNNKVVGAATSSSISNSSSATGVNNRAKEENGLKIVLNKLKLMLLPTNSRALCIILGLIAAQQLSGNFSTIQYLEVLFKRSSVGIDSNIATILVLAVGLVSGACSTATVEGAGRRPLLIFSTIGSSITLAILAIYLMLDARKVDVSSANFLPVGVVILFQVAFQIGLGTLPNALIGELFPTEVKGVAGAIVTVFDGVLGFAVSKLYQVIGDILGAYAVYYFFSASCLLAFLMVTFLLPETKGRTFREIQRLLAGNNNNNNNNNILRKLSASRRSDQLDDVKA
ncbi:facilitated trehalose transporter Tret1-like isoform X2 [Polistes fuscatus]|uniref:facilitated trehalose transporter Tret1-like isoform X2 n=1 Tax=Polistes fuscatus TaxID=30207 RepID=UPI001CA88AD6|nr:facilitated trehalose transporter Tret1-like isoform X2 [Polistes fuscatus]XP_043497577.1 facilitated trehalose transporter Tret1-like isoform X2 [Polistes fuscatus]XP_043498374.1 facilitated trehalose transporter Tret1-like isoform X2 [Polistes fuscatus]XP_043498972.1 facilitated trehalose transporter Tret1-like isoform X2 [Polistes fuscatus]